MNDHDPGKRCSTAEVVTLDFINYRKKNVISHDIYQVHQWVGYSAKQRKLGYRLQTLPNNVSFCFVGS